MANRSTRSLLLSFFATLILAPIPPLAATSSSTDLERLVEAYFEEFLRLNPLYATFIGDHRYDDRLAVDIAPRHRREALELESRTLEKAKAIRPESLPSEDRLTLELFVRGRSREIEEADFPDHLLPLDQLSSLPVLLPMLGGGSSVQPFETVADYERWLARAGEWPRWVDQALLNMERGVELGIVQPWPIVQRLVPIIESQIVDDPSRSVFFQPIRRFPPTFSESDRKRLEGAYAELIESRLVPGYRRLLAYIQDVYLDSARSSIGLSAIRSGSEWYALLVRKHTTTELTPREIHDLGRREVSRVSSRIKRLARSASSLPESRRLGRPASLLDGYRDIQRDVEPRISKLFGLAPLAPLEIREVEAYRRLSAPGASYVPASADGRRAGRFYVNADERSRGVASEALFLHEAMPGHHLQISVQRERADLPRFRRFMHVTAFVEGWALYAESLGPSLGLYRTHDQRLMALQSELFRARRLVVDTGVHSLGWSRGRAIEYLGDSREVDRYIASPAQALAYKVGELRISALRREAEKSLGRRFDLRSFHDLVLSEGALPLDLLEGRVRRWVEDQLDAE